MEKISRGSLALMALILAVFLLLAVILNWQRWHEGRLEEFSISTPSPTVAPSSSATPGEISGTPSPEGGGE